MKVKKRRKSSRFRASQTARRGATGRTRGSGNQGGKGMSGTGKRGDQKNSMVVQMTGGNNYFGRDKTLRRGRAVPKLDVINLADIIIREETLPKKEGYLDLEGYKILGEGEVSKALKIKAGAASTQAKEKIESAGGELIISGEEAKEKKEEKAEKVEKNAPQEEKKVVKVVKKK